MNKDLCVMCSSDVSDLNTHVCDDCKIKIRKGEIIKRDGDVIVDITEDNDARNNIQNI